MITTKVTNILPIGNSSQALVSVEKVELDGEVILSVVCRNWRKLNVGDVVSIKNVAGFPTIIFTNMIIHTGDL